MKTQMYDGEFFLMELAERQTGKTTRAVTWVLDQPEKRAVMATSARDKERLLKEWPGLHEANVLTPMGGTLRSKPYRDIWIDNADYILTILLSQAKIILHPSQVIGCSFSLKTEEYLEVESKRSWVARILKPILVGIAIIGILALLIVIDSIRCVI